MLLMTTATVQLTYFGVLILVGGPLGALIYWWGFALLATIERKRFAGYLRRLRERQGLSASQVYHRTGINVERLESSPDSLLLPMGRLLDISSTLSRLYKESIKPGFLLLA
jgi:hypothetical protein